MDYLADPRSHEKHQFWFYRYEESVLRACELKEHLSNGFWDKLTEHVTNLNDNKYKMDAIPGQETVVYSKQELEELDEFFMGF